MSPRSSADLSMENSLVIIPARHAARRFPGKMLAQLNGRFGSRSVIEYSGRGAGLEDRSGTADLPGCLAGVLA